MTTDTAAKATHAPRPSTPFYGGIVALTVIASALIVLTYTLLPLPGQLELGVWNYAAAVVCLMCTTIMVKRFRPAHFDEEVVARPRVKAGR